jgi:hypothetical protein
VLNSWLGIGALIVFAAIALGLIILAVLVASFSSSTVARLVGQLVMFVARRGDQHRHPRPRRLALRAHDPGRATRSVSWPACCRWSS